METLTRCQLFSAAPIRPGPGWMRGLAHAALLVALHAVGGVQAQALPAAVTNAADADAAAREAGAVAGETLYLFQRVAFGPAPRSVVISVDFTPAAWRVGSPGGPAATEAQLKSVFGELQHIIVAGRCIGAAIGARHRPCAFALGNPDFAGIVNPEFDNAVFGWVATAPASTLGTGDTASMALRYFGLLSPMRYASRAGPGAMVALRYREAASMQLPPGFDRRAASLIIHNDRLAPLALRTPGGYEALAQRIAGR